MPDPDFFHFDLQWMEAKNNFLGYNVNIRFRNILRMPYELTLEKFSGPLEKLLELIEEQKLDVNEVSMAKVTDDFLKYLDAFRKEGAGAVSQGQKGEELFRADLRLLADFISIASRLIFLKSKYLLPNIPLTEEQETDIKDLEARLMIYRDLRPAFRIIGKLWVGGRHAYSRPYFLGRGTGLPQGQSVFYPGKTTDIARLSGALSGIFEMIKKYELEEETIQGTIVSLEEKIHKVLERILSGGDADFKNLADEKSRSETIVVFLAVLHLAREQLIRLEQIENFSDIMVRKTIRSDESFRNSESAGNMQEPNLKEN